MKHKKTTLAIGIVIGIVTAASISANANRLSQFNDLAEEKGNRLGVNPNLIRAIVSVESAGRIDAVSNKGASGVMQLMPATAERMGIPTSQLFNPERNMEAGVRYLSYLGRLFDNNPRLMAAAYNAGEGAVMKYKGVPPYKETQNYAPAVVNRLNLLEQCGTQCYTSTHMANPTRYTSGAVQQYQQYAPQPIANNKFAGWLGTANSMVIQPQPIQPIQQQAQIAKPKPAVKQFSAVAPAQATIAVASAPKAKRKASFVATDSGDGTFTAIEPIH